jgi:cell division protein FtsN
MDFGDVIFFIVFVIIIITNIMKQLKKAGKQTSGKETTGIGKPEKKSGWKNVLEQMLEEARKQMENPAEPESAGVPLKQPTGRENITSGTGSVQREPGKRPERAKGVRPPKQTIIYADAVREKSGTAPERKYQKLDEKLRAHEKIPAARLADAALPAGEIKIPLQLPREGLINAVVWSEILGKPLGLRDLEI